MRGLYPAGTNQNSTAAMILASLTRFMWSNLNQTGRCLQPLCFVDQLTARYLDLGVQANGKLQVEERTALGLLGS